MNYSVSHIQTQVDPLQRSRTNANADAMKNPARKNSPAPIRFGFTGGALGAFSWGVDLLEKRAIELTATDFLGMCVPRSYVEYKKRGWDAARENVIREVTAMVFNVFVAGWLSVAMLKTLTNKVKPLNPLGVNHQAWLDVEALDVYITQIYRDILKRPNIKSPKQAEEVFTHEILSRLQSTGATAGNKSVQHITDLALNENPALRKQLLGQLPNNGKLSPDVVQKLTTLINKPFDGIVGKTDLMGQARTYTQRFKTYRGDLPQNELYIKRMELSKSLLGLPEKDFISVADPMAKLGGLTENVNLLDKNGKVILESRGRVTTLKQIRYCLHEVLNRAHHTSDGQALKATDPEWKAKALETLYRPRGNSLAQKLLPTAKDGLMDYILKSERFTTVLPLFLTIIGGISVAFINNHITKKRHGGKVFSPIEEGLRDKMKMDTSKAKPSSIAGGIHV